MSVLNLEKIESARAWHHREDDEAFIKEHLNFEGKADYLEWVRSWKATYKELSSEIRRVKTELSKPHTFPESAYQMGEKLRLKAQARILLAIRHAGKKASWAQKLKAAEGESVIAKS